MFGRVRSPKRYSYEPIFPPIQRPLIKSADGNAQEEKESEVISDPRIGLYEQAEPDPEQIEKEVAKQAENGEIEIVCNGIRYKTKKAEIEAVPDLICEECETSLSEVKCEACDQVFCSKCYVLCHERLNFGKELHPHEVDKMIRPIRAGDTSRIVPDNSFVMPDHDFYERDMAQVRDVSKPCSLATNTVLSLELNKPRKHMLYKRGDVLVYKDPHTGKDVYGSVESDWDFRNGDSAPTLIRGNGGAITWYVIRYLGVVTPDILRRLERDDRFDDEALEEDKEDKQKLADIVSRKHLPILEGVEYTSLGSERVMANRIDRRLRKAKYIRDHGPKRHLNPSIPMGFGGDGSPRVGEDESSAGAIDEESDANSVSTINDGASKVAKSKANTSNDHTGPTARTIGRQISQLQSTRKPTIEELRAKSLPNAVASRRTLDGVVAAYSYIEEVRAALSHMYYDSSSELPLLERRSHILIMPEDSLIKPSDRLKLMLLKKKENIRNALTKRFAAMFNNWQLWALHKWWRWNLNEKVRIQTENAVRIQAMVRRWLCRFRLQELINLSQEAAHKRWLEVHKKFNYCSRDTPGAVTMDNKIYFSNIRDINAYGKALRIAVSRFVRVAQKNRMTFLKDSFKRWNDVVMRFKEADLQVTHWASYDVEKGSKPEKVGRVGLIEKTRAMHQDLHNKLGTCLMHPPRDCLGNGADADPSDDSRFHINSMPMGLHREESDSGAAPPPWHPSVGFTGDRRLPDLMQLPDLVIKNKNTPVGKSAKHSSLEHQKYNTFRARVEGPTDHSNWVIPGRLAMGRLPIGKARAKGPVDSVIHTRVDAVSQLLLVGLNSFVSLMTAEEEEELIKQEKRTMMHDDSLHMPIKERVEYCHKETRMALHHHIGSLTLMVEDKNIQLEDYANIETSNTSSNSEKLKRIERQRKEKLRLKAKKSILQEEIETTKKAASKLPTTASWQAFPFLHNSLPPFDHVIAVLWKLEQMLWNGECLYIYSSDGNGRAGMICGCLLGRLYGLTPTETLLRMQTYFDCQRSQMERQVAANCPLMRRQQELVTRILLMSNRIYQGVSHRAQSDPESYVTEIKLFKRGIGIESGEPIIEEPKEGKYQKKTSLTMQLKDEAYVNSSVQREQRMIKQLSFDETSSDMYEATSLNSRSLTVIRNLPKYRPTLCEAPLKLHT